MDVPESHESPVKRTKLNPESEMAPGIMSPPPSLEASNTNGEFAPLQANVPSVNGGHPETEASDVLVVGAGPAGLMLASNLARFGINVEIVDNRPDRTATGRADGLQPKTVETLKQMRLAEPLLRKGVKIYDISFWKSTASKALHRTAREIHYPPLVDTIDPYILLVHQGMIEQLFLDDLEERGIMVKRNVQFDSYVQSEKEAAPLEVMCKANVQQEKEILKTRYLVGCDGAHSKVRRAIGSTPEGSSKNEMWGVLDGELETDFPDLWSKVVVYSETDGSVLIIPRERNMTRFYIELKPNARKGVADLGQEYVMSIARKIMAPYTLKWKTVEWFGRYQIGQRVASTFVSPDLRAFIAGDASHTHSPKAAQGMNTSMHDAWNLAWKLNLSIRGLSKPALLESYELERRKIAQDLINFDYEHANAFANGDPVALAKNFKINQAFISGFGVKYNDNIVNRASIWTGALKPGCLLPPARATRYIDANPVDLQLDIPMLGQFRLYFFTHNAKTSLPFLDTISANHFSPSSFFGRLATAARASYASKPPTTSPMDQYICPSRYTSINPLFTYALVTDQAKSDIEISDLPPILSKSPWTFYLDDIPASDTKRQGCIEKWLGGLHGEELAIAVVRPDGYCAAVRKWGDGSETGGAEAVMWMDEIHEGFLQA